MIDKFSEYTINLAGYKMELLIDSLEYYESEYPSFEIQDLINVIKNAEKKEYEV